MIPSLQLWWRDIAWTSAHTGVPPPPLLGLVLPYVRSSRLIWGNPYPCWLPCVLLPLGIDSPRGAHQPLHLQLLGPRQHFLCQVPAVFSGWGLCLFVAGVPALTTAWRVHLGRPHCLPTACPAQGMVAWWSMLSPHGIATFLHTQMGVHRLGNMPVVLTPASKGLSQVPATPIGEVEE